MRFASWVFLLCFIATGASAAPVQIKLWHSYRGGERLALEKTIDRFHQGQDAVRIESTFIPYDAFLDKLNASIPHGHGPDLFIAAHDRIGSWADSGLIAAIDRFLEGDVLERFFPITLDPLVYRGAHYGLPTSFKSTVLFYNRDLIERPPQDTEEMVELARSFVGKRNAAGQSIYGLAYDYSNPYFHAGWLHGFGGSFFNSRGDLSLDSLENVHSLVFVRRLVEELRVVPVDISSVKVTSLFNSGRAAMVISGPWFRGEIEKNIPYGAALLPVVKPTGLRALPFVGSETLLLSAKSQHPTEAFWAMDALTRDEAARIRLQEGMQPVANHRLYLEPGAKTDPVLSIFKDQLQFAVPMRNDPKMQLLWEPLGHAILNATSGRTDPREALADAQKKASLRIDEIKKGEETQQHAAAQSHEAAFAWGLWGGVAAALLVLLLFRKRLWQMHREAFKQKHAYAYVAPAMLAVGLLVFVPFLVGLCLGFFRYHQGQYFFVGLENFIDILSSREYAITDPFSFYYKLFITLLWTMSNVIIHLVVGLGLALLLKDPLLKCKGLYRVLLIVPWAIPSYITAIVWRGMFDADDGVINHLLGLQGFSWWQSTGSAFLANLVTNAWLGFPFMMVVSLGALQSIPKELYEAADVDGAGRFRKFRHITLPLLKPALFPAIILGVIWTFNMFNVIYLVSRGAPNGASDILVVEAFRWAFERGDRVGYAAAYSTLIFVILFLYTILTNRVSRATRGALE